MAPKRKPDPNDAWDILNFYYHTGRIFWGVLAIGCGLALSIAVKSADLIWRQRKLFYEDEEYQERAIRDRKDSR